MTEETRLKKFLHDQEEAVTLARSTPEGSNPVRVDSLNAALNLACTNAAHSQQIISMADILKDAAAAEKYLKGSA